MNIQAATDSKNNTHGNHLHHSNQMKMIVADAGLREISLACSQTRQQNGVLRSVRVRLTGGLKAPTLERPPRTIIGKLDPIFMRWGGRSP